MTPFEEFRLWLRQGAPFERATAAVAGLIALAMIVWVLVPSSDSTGTGQMAAGAGSEATSGAPAAGARSSGPAAGPTASGDGETAVSTALSGGDPNAAAGAADANASSGAAPATTPDGGQASPAATPGDTCGAKGSTDQGVTDTTVTVAVILLDVAGGNSILGVPPPGEQRKENDAVIAGLNAKGGLLCRKIVAKYYTDNPLDAASEHSICLDIVASKVFAVIGGLYQPQNSTCLPQNRLPTYTQTIRPTSEMKKFSPYLYSFYNDSETNFRTYVAGAKAEGFFNGMTKLGVITTDCYAEYNTQLLGALGRAGVPSSKIVTFDYGCPTANAAPPSTVSQAVLKFQQSGVNRVMTAGMNLASFSRQAQSQGYKPQYAASAADATLELTPSAGFAPDPQNFDGALDISNTQYGATNTPGVALSAETNNCNDMLVKGKTAWKAQDGDGYAGGVCNQWTMLALGATHAGTLVREQLAVGLNKVGHFEQSFPGAPADWNQPGKTWAGPFTRPVRFNGSCKCWKVTRAEFSNASI
jgi:hypothetical protein